MDPLVTQRFEVAPDEVFAEPARAAEPPAERVTTLFAVAHFPTIELVRLIEENFGLEHEFNSHRFLNGRCVLDRWAERRRTCLHLSARRQPSAAGAVFGGNLL